MNPMDIRNSIATFKVALRAEVNGFLKRTFVAEQFVDRFMKLLCRTTKGLQWSGADWKEEQRGAKIPYAAMLDAPGLAPAAVLLFGLKPAAKCGQSGAETFGLS